MSDYHLCDLTSIFTNPFLKLASSMKVLIYFLSPEVKIDQDLTGR